MIESTPRLRDAFIENIKKLSLESFMTLRLEEVNLPSYYWPISYKNCLLEDKRGLGAMTLAACRLMRLTSPDYV
jgi:hypothetical protein